MSETSMTISTVGAVIKVLGGWGVWRRGRGWLRGGNGQPLAWTDKDVATEVAERLVDARVYWIDKDLEALQSEFLAAEQRSIRERIARLWRH